MEPAAVAAQPGGQPAGQQQRRQHRDPHRVGQPGRRAQRCQPPQQPRAGDHAAAADQQLQAAVALHRVGRQPEVPGIGGHADRGGQQQQCDGLRRQRRGRQAGRRLTEAGDTDGDHHQHAAGHLQPDRCCVGAWIAAAGASDGQQRDIGRDPGAAQRQQVVGHDGQRGGGGKEKAEAVNCAGPLARRAPCQQHRGSQQQGQQHQTDPVPPVQRPQHIQRLHHCRPPACLQNLAAGRVAQHQQQRQRQRQRQQCQQGKGGRPSRACKDPQQDAGKQEQQRGPQGERSNWFMAASPANPNSTTRHTARQGCPTSR